MPAAHEAELAHCPSARTPQIFPKPLRSSTPHTGDGVCVEVYRARDLNLVAVHSEHLISLQLKGSGDLPQHVTAHGSRMEIRAGNSINITPAGVPAHWRYDGEDEVLVLRIAPSLLESVAAKESRQPAERVELVDQRGIRDARIERLGARFLEELMVGGFASRTCVQLLANLLAIHLLRQYSTIGDSAGTPPSKLARHKLRQATDYIDRNLRDDLSLGKISEVLCMSPCHFAHLFKQTTGHSPHRYVIDCRTERAKSLLRETTLPVSEIAQMVGYSSPTYFSTIFRQITGQSPLRYRDSA
jgi:AraC family transcriptional regulator